MTHIHSVTDYNKILIIRLSSIGDIILTTPLIRALRKRFPEAVIDFVVKEQFLDLVRTNPHLSSVIVFDHTKGFTELRRIKRLIRREQYDIILDIHRNFRSFYLRTFSGAGTATHYHKYYLRRLLLVWFGINTFRTIEPVYKRYFYAALPFGIVPDDEGTELYVPDLITDRVRHVLEKSSFRSAGGRPAFGGKEQPLVVLCPGAGFATKRWFPDGFAKVGDYFIQRYGAFVCIAGSNQDEAVCREVQRLMYGYSEQCAGMFTLLESAALLKQASLVVTNDTGLMHIAESQKRPLVALFGSTSRELGYYPFSENSFVIEKDILCRPCTHNGRDTCPKKHFDCMMTITPEEVIEAAEQLFISEKNHSGADYGTTVVSGI